MEYQIKLYMRGEIPSGIDSFAFDVSETVFDMIHKFLIETANDINCKGEVEICQLKKNRKE